MTMHRSRTRPPADPWSDWALDVDTSQPGASEPEAVAAQVTTPKPPKPPKQPVQPVQPVPADQQWAPNFESSVGEGTSTRNPASTVPSELVEDFTGEFDDIDAGEWDDAPFQYLDDPASTAVVLPANVPARVFAASKPAKKPPTVPTTGAKPTAAKPATKRAQAATLSNKPSAGGKPVGQSVRSKPRGRRALRRVGLGVLAVVTLTTAYVTWQFATLRRNEANSQTLDLPGVAGVTVPVPSVPSAPVTSYPNELDPTVNDGFDESLPADGVTIAPGPTTPVVTVPGAGSCDDDPACANAPVVVLPEAEKPREGGLLVDRVNVEPIGGADAQNILLIGSDSRADVPDSQKTGFGSVGGSRSDTIIVMRISPDGKKAALLSFPRDTYVHLAGTNKNDRINSAYAKGVNSLVRTLQENFNLPINHVAEVDFAGFQEIVGTLGGIEICFDHPARDKVTKLDVPAGCQILNKTQSTAYVRSRHYEQLVNGQWKSDGRGDIGRVQRQQRFIKQVMEKVIGSGGRNPITAQGLIGDLKSALTLDKTYGITELYGTAKTFSAFEPDALQGFTLPTSAARIDGKAVLRVRRDQASQVVALFGTRG